MKTGKIIVRVLLATVSIVAILFVILVIYARYFYSPDADVKSYYIDSFPLTTDRFQEDFDEIAEIVKENYSLGESKHLDLDSLCTAYAARVKSISTPREYAETLREFFASLRVGHSFVFFKSFVAGTTPVVINDSVFIDRPDSRLIEAGFRNKDRIIAVNGEPTADWMDRNEKFIAASTPLNRRIYTAREMFKSLSDTIRNFTVSRGTDTVEIKLPLVIAENLPPENFSETTSQIINDSIGYLAINTMADGVLESFTQDFNKIRNLPCLIVDIRNNEGGNSANGRELCRYFLRKNQLHCIDKEEMRPSENAYNGKVVLLTSPITFSAAESFAIDMKESGNVVLIGEPTAGDTGNRPRTFETTNGICFRIPTAAPDSSPQGFPLEGTGVAPHHHVSQTVSDYLNGIDTQLKFAQQYLMDK